MNRRLKNSNFLEFLLKKHTPDDPITSMTKAELLDYYISFVENHPHIVIIFSKKGDIMFYDRQAINKYLGYHTRRKVNFQQVLSKNDYNLLKSALIQSLKGAIKQVEFNVTTKNQKTITVFGTFVPIKSNIDTTEKVFLILEDITERKLLEKSYKLKANHLEQAQQLANIGSWEYIISENKVICSEICTQIFGFNKRQLTKDEILASIYPDDRDSFKKLIKQTISKGSEQSTKFRFYHQRTAELRYLSVKFKITTPIKLIGVAQDITEVTILNKKLNEKKKNYHYIFDHLNVGIWMRESLDGKVTFASKSMETLLQVPLAKIYKNPNLWFDMIIEKDKRELLEKYKQLYHGQTLEHKYRIQDGSGTTKWIYEQSVSKLNEDGEISHLFSMLIDISSEVEVQKRLEFLAKYDEITSLPNYYSLDKKIDKLILNETPFSLLYIELDNFHWIHNFLGRELSSDVLKNIANRLIAICPQNSYLAKIDDDSFVIILCNYKNKEVVFHLGETIIKKIKNKINVDDYEIYVTVSMGISFYPDNGTKKRILLKNAHSALYHAKKLGKNNYQIYSSNRDISSHKKYLLEKDLRKAIENESFELYYQPQINPKTGKIQGAEALIRWHHEKWGTISPAEFIPLAEEKHLIHEISDWVIKKVCEQLKIWKDDDYPLFPIAINISPNRFMKPGLIQTIKTELTKQQIPAKYLELEVTENSLLQNTQIVSNHLTKLKEIGVNIVLDDFGTEYSSYHYLQTFDIDKIKIDRTFIQNLFKKDNLQRKSAAIVSSFIYLAKKLNIKIVAEGIEEYEQFKFLKQKECDLIQGYIYSKPAPAKKFKKLINKQYLKPNTSQYYTNLENERRKYFRFEFPYHILAQTTLTKVGKKEIDIGYTPILIENISLGGIRFLSTLRIPVISNLKLEFDFKIMDESFKLQGTIIYRNEEKREIYSYGASLTITEAKRDKLAYIINQMTIRRKKGEKIPNTPFIEVDPYIYLRKNQ